MSICDSEEGLFCSLENSYGCTSKLEAEAEPPVSCTQAHLCNAPWSLLAPVALGLLIIVVFVLSGCFWCCCCCCGGRCCRQTCPRYVNEYSCRSYPPCSKIIRKCSFLSHSFVLSFFFFFSLKRTVRFFR